MNINTILLLHVLWMLLLLLLLRALSIDLFGHDSYVAGPGAADATGAGPPPDGAGEHPTYRVRVQVQQHALLPERLRRGRGTWVLKASEFARVL